MHSRMVFEAESETEYSHLHAPPTSICFILILWIMTELQLFLCQGRLITTWPWSWPVIFKVCSLEFIPMYVLMMSKWWIFWLDISLRIYSWSNPHPNIDTVSHSDVISRHQYNFFSWKDLWRFSISNVNTNLPEIFRNFQNDCPILISSWGSWIWHQVIQSKSLHFDLLIDALIQILTMLIFLT